MDRASFGIVFGVLALAGAAPGEPAVRLAPVPASAPTPEGFLPAKLTVSDADGELGGIVRAVSLRRHAGGPTIIRNVTIAPGTARAVAVDLPVVSVQEAYVVRLLGGEGDRLSCLRELSATLTTESADLVERARAALIDPPAYDPWTDLLCVWPAWLQRSLFLAGVAVCVVLGAALLVRRPAWRLGAVLAASAAGTVLMASLASQCETVVLRRAEGLTIATCRRTTPWSPPAHTAPVYRSLRQMGADDLLYRGDGTRTVTLRPEGVRLFRRHRPATTAPAP